jgi:Ni/Co efflux regulator RcnB
MKLPRIKTRLLAALLALIASFAVPVARHETARSAQQIVWVEKKREARRESVETREVAAPTFREELAIGLSYRAHRPRPILASSLFQRPPPPAFLQAQK